MVISWDTSENGGDAAHVAPWPYWRVALRGGTAAVGFSIADCRRSIPAGARSLWLAVTRSATCRGPE